MLRSENRSRKESREALIASLPVDDNGDVPEDFLRRRNNLRSARSRAADGRSTAKRVYPRNMPPEQAAAWVMNPGRYDVEGIDCDGEANIPRRGTNTAKAPKGKTSKPKAPAKKPAKPKAKTPTGTAKPKAPTKPKGPASKKPKAPVSAVFGSQVAALVSIINASDCAPIAMGNGQCSMESSGDYGIALSKRDGKGLFGLDNDAVDGLCAYTSNGMADLEEDAVYTVTLRDGKLVFGFDDDIPGVALKASTLHVDSPFTSERLLDGFDCPPMFDVDVFELRQLLSRMEDAKATKCTFESSKDGVTVTSSGGKNAVRGTIGSPMRGGTVRSSYDVRKLNTLLWGLTPYAYSMGFCLDGPMVIRGRIDDYSITAVIRSSGGSVPKQPAGRRSRK